MEQEINGKVQKINDEDYEIVRIIETETYPKAVKWYLDNYNCNLEEAIEGIDKIKKTYKADHIGLYMPDLEDNIFMLEKILPLIAEKKMKTTEISFNDFKEDDYFEKWIMSKSGCTMEVASEKWLEAAKEQQKRHPQESSGCLGLILIAIISTLTLTLVI